MAGEAADGVRHIGDTVDYADGAEEELLSVISGANDLSSRSDELPAHIHDWPTKYHLSRLRSNLLRPLIITEGLRVVDVGAGTGAIARYLGEQGASVLAVEGTEPRARVARERCRDLENVEVVAGDIAFLHVDQPFDLAVVCGVLEYASAPPRGPDAGARFLAQIADLVASDGAVALAIENQLGLKYLLGLPEDHLGQAGVGVEGYAADAVAQTFSRRQLSVMLEDAGFTNLRWLFPFPDYKLPTVMLDERIYQINDAPFVIDQLLRNPVVSHDRSVTPWMDPRPVHRSFVEAGLGPDVANSFLVVAGRNEEAVSRFVRRDDLAWLFGDERRSVWLRDRALVRGESGMSLELRSGGSHDEHWLRHVLVDRVPFEVGRSIEQLAVEACRAGDTDGLSEVLVRWLDAVRSHVSEREQTALHPFSPVDGENALPGVYLDINLDNFVVGKGEGAEIVFVDTEWSAHGSVALALVVYRALWWFARRVLGTRGRRMWPLDITVEGVTAQLGDLLGVDTSLEIHRRFVTAESLLQEIVSGESSHHHAEEIERTSSASMPLREHVIEDIKIENDVRLRVIEGLKVENDVRLRVIEGLKVENDVRLRTIEDLLEIRATLDGEIEYLRRVLARTEASLDAAGLPRPRPD